MLSSGDLSQWAIDLLLKWSKQDPVSDKERNRNDEVYKLQSNRNPFIDYPDLVEYIWGSMKGKPYTDEDLPPIGDGSLIAPVNNSTVNFGEVVYGDRVTLEMPACARRLLPAPPWEACLQTFRRCSMPTETRKPMPALSSTSWAKKARRA